MLTLNGKVSGDRNNRKFTPNSSQRWQYALGHFKHGEEIQIELSSLKESRSTKQNRYMWLCLGIIADHTGHTPQELHKLFKGLFLPPKIITLNGKSYRLAGSTANLKVGEFIEYMMRISAEAGSMGIVLPDPSEYNIIRDNAPTL